MRAAYYQSFTKYFEIPLIEDGKLIVMKFTADLRAGINSDHDDIWPETFDVDKFKAKYWRERKHDESLIRLLKNKEVWAWLDEYCADDWSNDMDSWKAGDEEPDCRNEDCYDMER